MVKVDKVFSITKNTIYAKEECIIYIDKKKYDIRTFVETSTTIFLPGLLEFYVPVYSDFCRIYLLYNISLHKTSNLEMERNIIKIIYSPGDTVITSYFYNDTADISLLTKLLNSRIKYIDDPKVILIMLHKILPEIDLVHLELIISNMFRKNDTDELCRFSGDYRNSQIYSVLSQAFENWGSALSFQDIRKVIKNSLISGSESQNDVIEKLTFEKFDEI